MRATVVPGFVDPHLHLLAMAAARVSTDLTGCGSTRAIAARMAAAAERRPAGSWLRGFGYDAHALPAREAVTREDLDLASARHPIVIHERSGHEVVCNSLALARLRLGRPLTGGTRRGAGVDGGRLDPGDRRLRAVPPLDAATMRGAMCEVSRALSAAGVTAVTDAGARNGPAEVLLLAQLREQGALAQRVEAMVGAANLSAVVELGWRHGGRVGAVVLGHVKIVAEAHTRRELADTVAHAHSHGWPVAVHVLDVESLDATLAALKASPAPSGSIDRIEHLALSLPEQLEQLAVAGAAVVTQPSFLVDRAVKYRRQLTSVERSWLYRVRSLLDRGILVAASSDAPVTHSAPLLAMRAACTRGVDRAAPGADREAIAPRAALELVTRSAARVGAGPERPPAGGQDFVVLDGDPLRLDREPPRVLATYIEGRPAFEAPEMAAPAAPWAPGG